MANTSVKETWSSKWVFILAAVGAAVGLGNIWKFPYIVGVHGGSAFILIYLLCILLIGLPLMMAELMIGRIGGSDPVHSMQHVAHLSGRSKHWGWVGFLGIVSCVIVLSYYAVIAGWSLHYLYLAVVGTFHQVSNLAVKQTFNGFMDSPLVLMSWQTVVLLLTAIIVVAGVKRGLERAIVFMLPFMVLLLAIVLIYGVNSGGFSQAIHFLFHPNFAALTPDIALVAMGHAFFSLSLAIGTMMMYGAYVPKKVSIFGAAAAICAADTGVALLAGLAIFPIVFAQHIAPNSGPGLIFQSLPFAFAHLPLGHIIGVVFFMMLAFAALTSTISMLEPPVVWVMQTFGLSRQKAVVYLVLLMWLLGVGTVLSFNHWDHYEWLKMDFFEWADHITANILMPLTGLLIALFAGWFLKRKALGNEGFLGHRCYRLWWLCIAIIAPIAIVIVGVNSLLG